MRRAERKVKSSRTCLTFQVKKQNFYLTTWCVFYITKPPSSTHIPQEHNSVICSQFPISTPIIKREEQGPFQQDERGHNSANSQLTVSLKNNATNWWQVCAFNLMNSIFQTRNTTMPSISQFVNSQIAHQHQQSDHRHHQQSAHDQQLVLYQHSECWREHSHITNLHDVPPISAIQQLHTSTMNKW